MSLTEESTSTQSFFSSDEQFNRLFPINLQLLASRHWTPLNVACKTAKFLAAEKGAKILDIGSGIGKFCLAAAHYKPEAQYFGIEQRKNLVAHAELARRVLNFDNVQFINANFTQVKFNEFDHFYFYNSFYENLPGTQKIDDSISYTEELYNYYHRYLYNQLAKTPPGTRVATFHSLEDEMPKGFHIVGSEIGNLLKFWIKI